MFGTLFCIYETPCGWCTRLDKECTEKGGCKKKMHKAVAEPVEEKLLNPLSLGEYAAKFAENHGMTISEAMEQPMVRAYREALSARMKPLV